MMIKILFFCLVLSSSVFAQTQEQARKYYGDKESDYVEGSPFLFDDFKSATIVDGAGKIYNNISIKYNLFKQEAVFKNEGGEIKKFGDSFNEIRIKNFGTFKNGFSNPMYGNANTLYEVLFSDKLQLLKLNIKRIEDGPLGYNDAHPVKKYVAETKYYLIVNNKWSDVTKSKKSLLKNLGDKESSVNQYISQNKLNVSNQNDLIAVVTYINSLL